MLSVKMCDGTVVTDYYIHNREYFFIVINVYACNQIFLNLPSTTHLSHFPKDKVD